MTEISSNNDNKEGGDQHDTTDNDHREDHSSSRDNNNNNNNNTNNDLPPSTIPSIPVVSTPESSSTPTTTPSSLSSTSTSSTITTTTDDSSSSSSSNPQQQQQIDMKKKSIIDQEQIRLALHRSPYFTCLDEEQIQLFIQYAKLVEYQPGQAIILEGCRDERDDDENEDEEYEDDYEYEYEYDDDEDYDPNDNTTSTTSIRRRLSTDGYADTDEYFLQEEVVVHDDPTTNITTPNMITTTKGHDTNQQQEEQQVIVQEEDESSSSSSLFIQPPPPTSGNKSYIYIIKNGTTDVLYDTIPLASLGPGTLFGEGGFLFGLPHSASIIARGGSSTGTGTGTGSDGSTRSDGSSTSSPLQCWVIDYSTFIKHILPSTNMKQLFQKYAKKKKKKKQNPQVEEEDGENKTDDLSSQWYMTMDDFIQSCLESSSDVVTAKNNESIANTFQHLMLVSQQQQQQPPPTSNNNTTTNNNSKNNNSTIIRLSDFCLFHLFMARPDPEVDIVFLLMDKYKTGSITIDDFKTYITSTTQTSSSYFDLQSEFVQRYFGTTTTTTTKNGGHHQQKRTIRKYQFSQFLIDLQREMGRQAFLYHIKQQQQHAPSNRGWGSSSSSSSDSMIRPLEEDGFLPPKEFVHVLQTSCGWRLSKGVADRLESIYCKDHPIHSGGGESSSIPITSVMGPNYLGTTPRYFSYGDFVAFQEVLEKLTGITNLIDHACQIKNGPISQDDFKVANRVIGLGGRLSRQQVDIIFQLFDLDNDGFISIEDVFHVIGVEHAYRLEAVPGRDGKSTFAPPPMMYQKSTSSAHPPPRHQPQQQQIGRDQGGVVDIDDSFAVDNEVGHSQQQQQYQLGDGSTDYLSLFFHAMQQFTLTAVAGGIGILAVYPLDLVKTRMQNQRIDVEGKGRMYLHSFHCLSRTVKHEGLLGLYRGLLPPLIAVGPEKAIKFAVNDMLKGLSTQQEHNSILWWLEIVSGGCAGACQLLVTNPLEITKIRMQLQGETARIHLSKGLPIPKPMSFSRVAADLGATGLYKGAAACLLRDIPFGAIYFPAYAACKDYLIHREGSTGGASASTLLLAGTMAGFPAALLTTPADMIKTRLQVIPRQGELPYNDIGDCIRKVYQQEGLGAFFKGSFFRVARIAPQFGISLLCYEKLCQLVGFKVSAPPTNVPIDPRDYRTAFPTGGIGTKTEDIDNLVRNMGFQPKPPPSSSSSFPRRRDP